MIFHNTEVAGAYLIQPEPIADERGYFARAWCKKQAQELGLAVDMVQMNVSYNKSKGTLRGLHYQLAPYLEAKLVRCTQGAIFDVLIDLRPGSPSFRQWIGLELKGSDQLMLYVPEHCAHGYMTLEDETKVCYLVSQFHSPEAERGIRFDDPAFQIAWPDMQELIVSSKDRSWPDFQEEMQK